MAEPPGRGRSHHRQATPGAAKSAGRDVAVQDIAAPPDTVGSRITGFEHCPEQVGPVALAEVCRRDGPDISTRVKVSGFMCGYEYFLHSTLHPAYDMLTWTLDHDRASDFDDRVGAWFVEPHPTRARQLQSLPCASHAGSPMGSANTGEGTMRKSILLLATVILLGLPQYAAAISPAVAVMVVGDGCAYPPDAWLANPDAWPVDQLDVGKRLRDKAELLALLDANGNGKDLGGLMRETIAAKLNVASGTPAAISPWITWADGLLAWGKVTGRTWHNIGDMGTINEVRRTLSVYNTQGCSFAAAAPAGFAKTATEAMSLGAMKAQYR